jgi:hypothetical protein
MLKLEPAVLFAPHFDVAVCGAAWLVAWPNDLYRLVGKRVAVLEEAGRVLFAQAGSSIGLAVASFDGADEGRPEALVGG